MATITHKVPKFKAGDTLRCVDPVGTSKLILSEEYTAKEVYNNGYGYRVRIEGAEYRGMEYHVSRFVKVNENKPDWSTL